VIGVNLKVEIRAILRPTKSPRLLASVEAPSRKDS